MTVTFTVNETTLSAPDGTPVLQACLKAGIFIPNLCFLDGMPHPPASCRLCFVEVEGQPVTACTLPVRQGLVVRTDTEPVRRLQRTALRFLLSVHDVDCKNCPANRRCELQRLAGFLKIGLKVKQLRTYLKEVSVDDGHPCLLHYPNRCVLCGRCVHVCRSSREFCPLAFAGRGFSTVIRVDPGTIPPDCTRCSACVQVCPVGALALKTDLPEPMQLHGPEG